MRRLARSAIMAAGLVACDAQRGPDYEGEALLTIQGSITRVVKIGKGEVQDL